MTPPHAPQPPRLLDQVRERLRTKHYSIRTEGQYVHWIKRFILFHSKRHPRELGTAEVEVFLTDLAVNGQVAALTQNQALSAILFLYREVLGRPLLGCPGNPVSLFVTAVLFARPLILRMQGVAGGLEVRPLRIRAGFDWPRPDRRLEFQRARLERGADGELEVAVYPSRSSAVLSSVAWADGLVQLQPGQVIARGDPVEFLPFAELLY